ncbi:MAG: hypothetical protein F7C34_01795 [Desulfurococcales archaeon]|nr:hypothetical protein [Desulfurococcales archaeon]
MKTSLLAGLVASLLLASAGLGLVALGSQSGSLETQAFASLFQVQRWNPPDYPGVMGVKYTVYNSEGEEKFSCTIGLPVYKVRHYKVEVPSPFEPGSDNPRIKAYTYVTEVYYYLLVPWHCVNDSYPYAYQPDSSGYLVSSEISYKFPVTWESDSYKPVDAALLLVETKTQGSMFGYPPPPPPEKYTNKIFKPWYSASCDDYGPDNITFTGFESKSELIDHYNNNDTFYKSGMATGLTRSEISDSWEELWGFNYVAYYLGSDKSKWAYGVPFVLDYPGVCGVNETFAEPGDSGSPVYIWSLSENAYQVVGLVSGAHDDIVFIVPLQLVLNDYRNLTGSYLYLYTG